MKTVTVKASRSYCVKIGPGLLQDLSREVADLGGVRRVCIVTDSNVLPLCGKAVADSLTEAGFMASTFVFDAGENSKNGTVFLELLNFLARNKLSRSDLTVALGGGVVGDMAGFAASVYLRGIRYIQVPTTLLAAVDSSVGGKTAIDLPSGKNLAGSFYQPSLVLCDTDALRTLPPEVFQDGCAEVIKYAMLYDPALFRLLEKSGPDFDREAVIARCVELKRDVVAQDEFDIGQRMKLNLGHTVGHAIEAASNYQISHGKAVAMGMAILARGSGCPDAGRLESLLQKFGLPVSTDYAADTLHTYALSDKKRSDGSIKLILPRRIGCCEIQPTTVDDLYSLIKAGL